jgi:hypothetical protein
MGIGREIERVVEIQKITPDDRPINRQSHRNQQQANRDRRPAKPEGMGERVGFAGGFQMV